jgi:hypothetical protein
MKITIYHVYGGHSETFQGEPEDLRKQLNSRFSHLASYAHKSLEEDIAKLASAQAFIVNVEG